MVNSRILCAGSVLVADNVAFHKSRVVLEFLESNNIRCIFLSPYSPQLNPIEEVFSLIKSRYKRIRPIPKNSQEIIDVVSNTIGRINSDENNSFFRYYSRMRRFVDKAVMFQPLIV
jgi:transposase